MSMYSSRLLRAIEYKSRLRQLSISGPSHAAYLSEHPDELASRMNGLNFLEKEIATADLESYDRETLLAEMKSYRKILDNEAKTSKDFFGALKPTWRDFIVVAVAAYAAWKGRDWFERKIEEFARKQSSYLIEEMKREK